MQCAILAGGLAERLLPLTYNIPKSMILIEGKPFLEYQIELLESNGIRDIILCIGYLGEKIEEYFGDGLRFGVNIRYSREQELLGTGGALKEASNLLDAYFFVLYGDSYCNIEYMNMCNVGLLVRLNMIAEAVMAIYKNENKFDKSNVKFVDKYRILYDKNGSKEYKYIDYGISYLSKKVLDLVPSNKFYNLADVFKILSTTYRLIGYEVFNRFYEIGSLKGLKEFKSHMGSL